MLYQASPPSFFEQGAEAHLAPLVPMSLEKCPHYRGVLFLKKVKYYDFVNFGPCQCVLLVRYNTDQMQGITLCKLHGLQQRTCTLRQVRVYTWFIQGDKCVYRRRQTCLPYTLHLICTVHVHVHV